MSIFAIPSPCQEADQVNNQLNRALQHEAIFLVKSLSLFLVSRAWGTASSSQLSSPASTHSCPNHLLRHKSCHFTGQKSFMAPHHLQDSLYLPGPLLWSPWFKPPSLSPELLQVSQLAAHLPSTLNMAKPSFNNSSCLTSLLCSKLQIKGKTSQDRALFASPPSCSSFHCTLAILNS